MDVAAWAVRRAVSPVLEAFVWCGCCHRVYPADWWMDIAEACPNAICDGTLDDAWAWGEALLAQHPDWPEAGEHYPLLLTIGTSP